MTVSRFATVSLLVLAASAGCGPSDDRVKLPTVPIDGVLMVDGKPFGPARLTLSPVPADGSRPVVAGEVAEDGKVRLSTYSTADEEPDGAPPGDYQVSFGMNALDPGRPMPVLKPSKVTVPAMTDSGEPVFLNIELSSTGKTANPMMPGGRPPGYTGPLPGR